jgi:hypothetical protein
MGENSALRFDQYKPQSMVNRRDVSTTYILKRNAKFDPETITEEGAIGKPMAKPSLIHNTTQTCPKAAVQVQLDPLTTRAHWR